MRPRLERGLEYVGRIGRGALGIEAYRASMDDIFFADTDVNYRRILAGGNALLKIAFPATHTLLAREVSGDIDRSDFNRALTLGADVYANVAAIIAAGKYSLTTGMAVKLLGSTTEAILSDFFDPIKERF